MEGYAYATSYPDSGDSSPRSREIDFENPPPWEDQSQPNPSPPSYKVKFMCSYGGKIHPRPHDNQLSYVGGETKILAVDRGIKFSGFISKLAALCDSDVCFKYQLPGEDLDALISVTNDDDLEHMMHEYDRLYRASARPARLRLFLFPMNRSEPGGFSSDEAKSDRERFVEALNSGPIHSADGSTPPATVVPNNVDLLFGLDKGVYPSPVAKLHDPVPEPEIPVGLGVGRDDRVIGSDLVEMQRRIEELQRLQIGVNEQAMYRPKSEENLAGAFSSDYYAPKFSEKLPPANVPVTMPASVAVPQNYWSEKQISGRGYTSTVTTTPGPEQQQMYMIHTATGAYHVPMPRPMAGQATQGYYVPRMAPEVYREQPVYNVIQQSAPVSTAPPSLPPKMAGYGDGINMVRPSAGGVGVETGGYTQLAYDSTGRQVFYNAQGGGMPQPPQYHGITAVSGDMRPVGGLGQEGKVVTKATV